MKKINKYYTVNVMFAIFILSANCIQAQNFEDKTVDAIIVTPVSLVSFNANKVNSDITLSWKTATEINNSHFVIERSTNGVEFSSIGQTAGRGNSNVVNSYSFTDLNTPNVNLYYRLQQVDFNANKSYSAIVLVRTTKNLQPTLSIFPNPVQHHKANINTSNIANGRYTLSVKSVDGKNILYSVENIIANNQAFQLQLPESIQSGVYLLQITNNVGTVNLSQKLVLQ